MNAILTIAAMNVRRIAGGRQSFIVLTFTLMPAVILGLLLAFGGADVAEHITNVYATSAFPLFFFLVIPGITLLYASSSIVDEIEQNTFAYLLVQPVPRWQIMVGKYLGMVLATQAAATLGIVASYLAPYLIGDAAGLARDFHMVRQLWTVAMLGIATYGAVLFLVSLLTNQVFIMGILYFGLLEFTMSLIPTVIQKCSILFYIKSLLSRDDTFQGVNSGMQFAVAVPPADTLTCLYVFAGYIAAALAVGALVMSRREFIPRHNTQN